MLNDPLPMLHLDTGIPGQNCSIALEDVGGEIPRSRLYSKIRVTMFGNTDLDFIIDAISVMPMAEECPVRMLLAENPQQQKALDFYMALPDSPKPRTLDCQGRHYVVYIIPPPEL